MTESIRLPAVKTKPAAVALPGSKSISNRSLLLAALSDNVCEIHSLLKSDDTDRMLDALAALGVKIEFLDGGRLKVYGTGGRFPNRSADLFLGNAGTAFRPLTAVLAVLGGSYSLHGATRAGKTIRRCTSTSAPTAACAKSRFGATCLASS